MLRWCGGVETIHEHDLYFPLMKVHTTAHLQRQQKKTISEFLTELAAGAEPQQLLSDEPS